MPGGANALANSMNPRLQIRPSFLPHSALHLLTLRHLSPSKLHKRIQTLEPYGRRRSRKTVIFKSYSTYAELSAAEEEWIKKLPDKKKPLYSHSLPCIEAWLRKLGFHQTREDRAVWFVEKPDWHAQISLDVTDLYIRYLKSGPGNLEKDVERRFSYALSREDIENAIRGGP